MSVRVEARGLAKSYRDGTRVVDVLSGIDLVVEPGELVAIVGPSGSGKSTLLHVLGTLDKPDAGEVLIGGQDVAALTGTRLAGFRNRTIGFVSQFHQLLPDFTALENVMLAGRIAGRSPAEPEPAARHLLDEVGLSHRERALRRRAPAHRALPRAGPGAAAALGGRADRQPRRRER